MLTEIKVNPARNWAGGFEAGRLSAVLEILGGSQMPVTAAHQIAKDNSDLPNLLRKMGLNPNLVRLATVVLDNLAHRENLTSVPPSLPSPLKNLNPADTGFHRE
ncbi:MAG: hypothetical protein A3I32_00155 [Candidatus Yanofskybacteria bacterium RIFCSPLOWO2_02_FULL_45_10]|nr:MAG: hypothetical protein A3I32_00155 [Candidatus Yanofskybacteria bacterium RIFCSPLOWO2_02_FULL_45_10]